MRARNRDLLVSFALSLAASTLVCVTASSASVPSSESTTSEVTSPAKGDSFAPRIVADGDGVILSWLERDPPKSKVDASVSRLFMSRFAKGVWSPASEIASGSNLFANWADTPTVRRASDGAFLATWLRSGALGGSVYDAVVSRSVDEGRTWTVLGPLHDDGKQAEHGFVSGETGRGATVLCWLDGRAMTPPDPASGGHDHGGGEMSLRAARTAPTKERPSPPSEILDERTCECCPTDLAIGAQGPIVVYRDRGEDETRDIALVRWLGEGWSQPQRIGSDGWKINGCPVNGPSISARGNDVVVAWWTGATAEGAVRAVRSNDGGASFGAVFEVDADGSLGRVETLLLPSGDALIIWQDVQGDDAAVVVRRLSADGKLGALQTIAQVPADRSSGFPRATLQGADLWLACTTEGDGAGEGTRRSVKVFRTPVELQLKDKP